MEGAPAGVNGVGVSGFVGRGKTRGRGKGRVT